MYLIIVVEYCSGLRIQQILQTKMYCPLTHHWSYENLNHCIVKIFTNYNNRTGHKAGILGVWDTKHSPISIYIDRSDLNKKGSMTLICTLLIKSLMQYKLSVKWIWSLIEFFFHLKQIHTFCKSHCFEHFSLKNVDGFVIIYFLRFLLHHSF